jgi:FAD synthetase
MKKVLIFGTFDKLHPGHMYVLEQASKLGELYVLVARDNTIMKVKGRLPVQDENERLKKIQAVRFVKDVFLGDRSNYFNFLNRVVPDIICLGYDQKFLVERLKEEIAERKLAIELITLEAFHPEKYKSSLLH